MDEVEEFLRRANLRTDRGEVIRAFPLRKVSLGQAVILVADGRVYYLGAVWNATEEDREGFRTAASSGAGWIDRVPGMATIPGVIVRGRRWCTHKGYSKEFRDAIRGLQVMAFGTVRPSQQSARMVVVGKDLHSKYYCGTFGGLSRRMRSVDARAEYARASLGWTG